MRFDNLMSLSRTHAKVVALLVAGALVTPMLSGCGADTSSTDSTDSTAATATSESTEETAETSETAADSNESSEQTSETTATEEATETSSSETSDTAKSGDSETSQSESTDTDSDSTSTDTSSDADSASSDSDTTEEEETIDFSYSQDIDDDGHWTGVIALDYVTLPEDYASISVPSSTAIPTDDDVQTQIDTMLSNYSTTEQVTDREVADGDTINIDYVGKIDGVEFDGGSTEGNGTTVTIGTTQYIDDFLEQLIGHKPGETFDIEVTFPDDYGNDELNGKDATFTVTINYISETTTPELTDDWVNENLSESYGWTTVDELKQGIKENLQYTNVASYVQDYVLNNSTVTEVPQTILDYQGQQYLYMYQQYATNYGYTFSEMLEKMTGSTTSEEFLTNNAESLENSAKAYLIFQAIMEDADITVTDDEVESYLESAINSTDTSSLEETYGKGYLVMRALLQKTGNWLVENAVVTEDDDTAADSSDTTTDETSTDNTSDSTDSTSNTTAGTASSTTTESSTSSSSNTTGTNSSASSTSATASDATSTTSTDTTSTSETTASSDNSDASSSSASTSSTTSTSSTSSTSSTTSSKSSTTTSSSSK